MYYTHTGKYIETSGKERGRILSVSIFALIILHLDGIGMMLLTRGG